MVRLIFFLSSSGRLVRARKEASVCTEHGEAKETSCSSPRRWNQAITTPSELERAWNTWKQIRHPSSTSAKVGQATTTTTTRTRHLIPNLEKVERVNAHTDRTITGENKIHSNRISTMIQRLKKYQRLYTQTDCRGGGGEKQTIEQQHHSQGII